MMKDNVKCVAYSEKPTVNTHSALQGSCHCFIRQQQNVFQQKRNKNRRHSQVVEYWAAKKKQELVELKNEVKAK